MDLAGKVTYVNRAAELMTGRTRHDLLGHPLGRLFETIEDAVPRGLSVATRLAPGERHRANTSDAWVLDRQEGLRTLIRYSAEPIHDRAGGIAGVIIVFRGTDGW